MLLLDFPKNALRLRGFSPDSKAIGPESQLFLILTTFFPLEVGLPNLHGNNSRRGN